MLCVRPLLCADDIKASISMQFIYPFENKVVFMLIFLHVFK